MIDSVCSGSVVVGGEVAAGLAGVPVVPESGGEREEALGDPGDQSGRGVGAVLFERELAFDRVEHGFDRLPDAAEAAEAGGLVFAVGAQEDPESGRFPVPDTTRSTRRKGPPERSLAQMNLSHSSRPRPSRT